MFDIIKNNFKVLLERNSLKISDISQLTNISSNTLRELYHQRSKSISFDILNRLVECLDCDVSEFLEYELPECKYKRRQEGKINKHDFIEMFCKD